MARIGRRKVLRRRLDRAHHSLARHVERRNHVGLEPRPFCPFPVVQHPVQALLGGVLVSAPGRRDASPAFHPFDSELERVRCLVGPGHRDGLKITRAEEVKVLNRVLLAELGNFERHANLVLVVGNQPSPILRWPPRVLLLQNGVAQGAAARAQLLQPARILFLGRLSRNHLLEPGWAAVAAGRSRSQRLSLRLDFCILLSAGPRRFRGIRLPTALLQAQGAGCLGEIIDFPYTHFGLLGVDL